jgi:hypothetical protein
MNKGTKVVKTAAQKMKALKANKPLVDPFSKFKNPTSEGGRFAKGFMVSMGIYIILFILYRFLLINSLQIELFIFFFYFKLIFIIIFFLIK